MKSISQPLQINKKQFKISITFLTGYDGLLVLQIQITNSIMQNQLLIKIVFSQNSFPPCAYEIQSLNNEIKRVIVDENHLIGTNYPFTRKPSFLTLGSILEIY